MSREDENIAAESGALLRGMAARFRRALDFERCAVALVNDDGRSYCVVVLVESREGSALGGAAAVPLERGTAARVLRAGAEPLVIEVPGREAADGETDPLTGPAPVSALLLPVHGGGAVVAALLLATSKRRYEQADTELGAILAAEIATELERRRTVESLAKSRDFYLTLFEEFPALIWRAGTDARCDYFNKEWLSFTGRTLDQERGDGWTEGVYPDDLAGCLDGYIAAFRARQPFLLEYRLRRADGEYRWIYDYGRPFSGLDGRFAGYIGSCYDVSDRKRLETVLRDKQQHAEQQYRAAEEASRLKGEFLANMSHELRTPLNSIIGFSELMHDGKVGPLSALHREYLGDVLTSARHLLQLVNDVLDLAKIESGKMTFRPEPVDLSRVVAEILDVVRPLRTGRTLVAEIDPAATMAVLDAARLKQVLYNYISNALKFTLDGGSVRIRIRTEGEGELRIEVEDDGIGIAAEDVPLLFAEFKQLNVDRGHIGSGLGLALTKRIVEAQGGRVGVESAPGHGSVFSAVLPRSPRELPAAAAVPSRPSPLQDASLFRHVVELDVTDRKRLEDELCVKHEELEEKLRRAEDASRMKSELLSNVSHELRTPLNSVIGFAELLHDGKVASAADQREYLGDILRSSRQLLELINDVLDLSTAQTGKMTFRPEPVRLGALVAAVLAVLRAPAARRGITIETRIDPGLDDVVIDPGRLLQVLRSYVSNAVKFSPDGARIAVRILANGESAFRIEVEDTGIGVRAEDVSRLFVPFQQLDMGAAKQGTDLGLALTKSIVETQGGRVGVRSADGRGSVFFAVLPRRPGEGIGNGAASTSEAHPGALEHAQEARAHGG